MKLPGALCRLEPKAGPRRTRTSGAPLAWGLSLLAGASVVIAAPSEKTPWPKLVEQDWSQAEQIALLTSRPAGAVTTQSDAAGGCDGIINGEWGFHTDDKTPPWWQVDLGTAQPISRVVVWNRGAAAERAFRLLVLVSTDGKEFKQVYQHDGSPFHGFQDKKPLLVDLGAEEARFVRVALTDKGFLHLDEVEVFGTADPTKNLALHRPANQSSVSQWSVDHSVVPKEVDWIASARQSLRATEQLLKDQVQDASAANANTTEITASLKKLTEKLGTPGAAAEGQALFVESRHLQRRLALNNPLLRECDTLLFTKRVPGSFNHMSDQYYGWWSKPGGGIFLLRGFTGTRSVSPGPSRRKAVFYGRQFPTMRRRCFLPGAVITRAWPVKTTSWIKATCPRTPSTTCSK